MPAQRPAPVAPWLALAAGVAALVFLILPYAGIAGPWWQAALAAAAIAVLCGSFAAFNARTAHRELAGAEARAAIADPNATRCAGICSAMTNWNRNCCRPSRPPNRRCWPRANSWPP